MADNIIKLKIEIDSKSGEAAINLTDANIKKLYQSFKYAKSEVNGLTTSISQGFNNAREIIQGFEASFRAFSSIMNSSLKDFQAQETANIQLATAMKQSGTYTEDAYRALQQYASQLQQTTTFGDDQYITIMAQLQAMGLSTSQTKEAALQTANLAALMGTDLNSAARVMADVFNGNTGMIGRYIKGLDESIIKSGDLNLIIQELNKSIGGQAEALANTSAGAITQMNNAISDLRETVGEAISKGLGPLITHIKNLAENINAAYPGLTAFIGIVGTAGAAFGTLSVTGLMPLLFNFKNLTTSIKYGASIFKLAAAEGIALRGALMGIGTAAKGLFASIGPAGWLILGVTLLTEALNLFSNKSDEAARTNNKLKESFRGMSLDELRSKYEQTRNSITLNELAIKDLKKEFDGFAKSGQQSGISAISNLSRQTKLLAEINKLVGEELILKEALREKEEELKASTEARYEALKKRLDIELAGTDYKKRIEAARQEFEENKKIIKDKFGLTDEQLKRNEEYLRAEKYYNETITKIKKEFFDKEKLEAFNNARNNLAEQQRHKQAILKLETDNDLILLNEKIKHFDEMIALYKKYGQDTTALVNQRAETELELSIKSKPEIEIDDMLPFEAEELADVQYGDVLDYARLSKEQELELWRKTELEKAAAYENSAEMIAAIEEEYARRRNDIRDMETQQALDAYNQMFENLSALFGQHTAAYKAMAIAQTIIETYKAATAALSPPPVGAGPLLGPILAITTLAAGFANVQKIASTKISGFQFGGKIKKGETGFIEGYHNEIIAPEKTFVEVFKQELRPQIYGNNATLNYDLSGIKDSINRLNSALEQGIVARAYLDDYQAKKITAKGSYLINKSKL